MGKKHYILHHYKMKQTFIIVLLSIILAINSSNLRETTSQVTGKAQGVQGAAAARSVGQVGRVGAGAVGQEGVAAKRAGSMSGKRGWGAAGKEGASEGIKDKYDIAISVKDGITIHLKGAMAAGSMAGKEGMSGAGEEGTMSGSEGVTAGKQGAASWGAEGAQGAAEGTAVGQAGQVGVSFKQGYKLYNKWLLPSKCDVIKSASSSIVGSGLKVASQGACIAGDAAVAGACEVAGIGPEDPMADVCAAILATAFEVACTAAIAEGGTLTADALSKQAGC